MSEATPSEHNSAKTGSTDSASPAWFADWADFSVPRASEPDPQEQDTAVKPSADVPDATPSEEWNDWQTVNFPNAISADAIDRQSLYTDLPPKPERPKAAVPAIALPNWGRPKPAPTVAQASPSQPAVTASANQPAQIPPSQVPPSNGLPPQIPPSQVPPSQVLPSQIPPSQVPPLIEPLAQPSTAQPGVNVADLMSLIQELNQCNSALIDRVSQLEDALDRSETALQAEIARSQEQVLADPHELVVTQEQLATTQGQLVTTQEELATAQEQLATAYEQVTQLTHQLEFTTQTQQRQQILVETLTTQLENSQERVAQLERNCALLQQQYNEQTHALTQSENTCRDLYARLHRQQRYTLQYKAALEKCLEVPPPSYESGADAGAAAVFQAGYEAQRLAPQSFLPKAQRIQPWSADSGSLTGKLEALVNSPVDIPLAEPNLSDDNNPPVIGASGRSPEGQSTTDQSILPTDDAADMSDEAIEAALLNAAVQPLTDLSPEAIQAGLDELQSVIDDFLSGKSDAPTDAELSLWQDLARLIEVSTDDVVKASAAQNFESFTTHEADSIKSVLDELTDSLTDSDLAQQKIPPAAIPPQQPSASPDLTQQIPPAAIPAQQPSTLKLPMSAIAAKIAAHASASKDPAILAAQSSTPSPLVYPLRPTKKLSSLAAVDLPTFPRKNEN
ncbi:hypothetical protein H6G89_15370 [Oscillatoria sp. FACHB-1407]|uniref:hypothetical protein n=1 Tax=Oscillatoria sp. FACHB-1407 TaxID=2692847 RepID=UPI0016848601|nr:hypothetical protein [Oscillatoria sp. FACHB-1407]MBD2462426.1 hypothetical protein [Oscillatoria sp. FACHB-1407]